MTIGLREQLRRKRVWSNSPVVEKDGTQICACCSKTAKLRHVYPGPGDICEWCYINKPRCKVSGCGDVAVKGAGGLCRSHFIDPDDCDILHIDQFGGVKASSISGFSELDTMSNTEKNAWMRKKARSAKTVDLEKEAVQ